MTRAKRAPDAKGTKAFPSDEPGRRPASAIEYAIALVAARSLPEKKLREKVAARHDPDETERAIARMRELRLVDDAEWAERFVRDRFEHSDKGRHRIRQELARRGIDKPAIDAAIERVLAASDERSKAARVLERMRARLDRGPAAGRDESIDESDAAGASRASSSVKNRLFRRMVARGYPVDLVRDLLAVS